MRMIRITCCALIAAVGAWVGPGEAAASPAVGSATAFLEAHDARVRTVVLRQPADSLTAAEREQVRVLINDAFDFRELARQSLGDVWEARTEAERDEFVDVYSGIIERSNLDMFIRYHRDGGISYTAEEIADDGRAVVLAEVPLKKEKKIISYSLHRPGSDQEWRIYDLAVDGAGTVAGNRRAWTRYISRHSYEKLLKSLRKKLARLEEAG